MSTTPDSTSLRQTLPGWAYFDPTHYAHELTRIFHRNWLYVCRADQLFGPRAYRTFQVGTQNLLILRDEAGSLHAFHNTCRHRGSLLCEGEAGILQTRSIVCPYHRWSYALNGTLQGVPFSTDLAGLDRDALSLYRIAVREWRGNVFINLAGDAAGSLESAMAPHADELANWPLPDLLLAHRFQKVMRCNWKVFWENYHECYHCPGVHPELCELVPIYGEAMQYAGEAGGQQDGMRPGAETWSMDGKIHGQRFASLTDEEMRIGYKYLTLWPTMFIAAHPDYVRQVAIHPLGPETTLLTAEWLFPQATLKDPSFDLHNVVDFGILVMSQDAEVCERNQRGLHSVRHAAGVLMPQEDELYLFHEWLRGQLGMADGL